MNAAQKSDELRQFLGGEKPRESQLMFQHFFPQSFERSASGGRDVHPLAPAIRGGSLAGHPLLALQAVHQADNRCLVDIQLGRKVDLRNSRVCIDQNQQAEHARAHIVVADRFIEIAPQGNLRSPQVVTQQIGQQPDADGRRDR